MSKSKNNSDKNSKYSGEFRIRMPKSLHEKLSNQAQEEGISLNQYIIYKLAKDMEEPLIKEKPFFSNLTKQVKEILELSEINNLGNLTLKDIKEIVKKKYKEGIIDKSTYENWSSLPDALKLQALIRIKKAGE